MLWHHQGSNERMAIYKPDRSATAEDPIIVQETTGTFQKYTTNAGNFCRLFYTCGISGQMNVIHLEKEKSS
jgi:hypothetical protein